MAKGVEQFVEIDAGAEHVRAVTAKIAAASEQQSRDVEQLDTVVERLSEVTRTTAVSADGEHRRGRGAHLSGAADARTI